MSSVERRGRPPVLRCPRIIRGRVCFALAVILAAKSLPAQSFQNHRQQPGHPVRLDAGVTYRRNPATGELETTWDPNSSLPGKASPPRTLRVTTQLVPITCTVSGSDGTPMRGLSEKDFHVYDNGVERPIAFFDAGSSSPGSVALVIDASPSVLRDSQQMKTAAGALIENLAPSDEVAVVDFSAHTYLQANFSSVRELLRRAVGRVDARQILGDVGGSNIYQSVYLTGKKLFAGRTGRKAIVLLTDGEDSGLGLTLDPASASPRPGIADNRLTFDDVARELAANDIQVFAVSTENRPRIMTRAWLASHHSGSLLALDSRKLGIPPYTLYLAELVRHSGGDLYFLNEAGAMADIFGRIATRVGAEYSLGIEPLFGSDSNPEPGWHQLRVAVVGRGDVSVINRAAYYVPASR